MKEKKNWKEKDDESHKWVWFLWTIFFLLLVLLAYFFPYVHDDWDWGSITGLSRLENHFAHFNGRYVGNLLVLLLTRFRLVRALLVAVSFLSLAFLSGKIISSKNSALPFCMLALLFCMPTKTFAQAVAWTSGFSNYVIPVVLGLVVLYQNRTLLEPNSRNIEEKKPVQKLWNFFLFFVIGGASTLFVEHMTIYHLILAFSVIFWEKVKKGKVSSGNFGYGIGALLGTYFMFFSGSFHGQDDYRAIADGNLVTYAFHQYFGNFYHQFVLDQHALNFILVFLCLLLVFSFWKKKEKISKISLGLLCASIFVLTIFGGYSFLRSLGFIHLSSYWEGTLVLGYLLSMVVLISITIPSKAVKNRIFFYFGSIFLLVAPLLVVNPIGPRCFFASYCFFAIIALELGNVLFSSNILYAFGISFFSFAIVWFLSIYGVFFDIEKERESYIASCRKQEEILLPKIPTETWLHHPNPRSKWFLEQFKNFYQIPQDTKLTFVNWEEWKREVPTCK